MRLGALLHDVGKPRARQPREGAPGEYSFFKHEYRRAPRWPTTSAAGSSCPPPSASGVAALVANHMFYYTPEWTDGTVRRFVRRGRARARWPALFALREADIAGRGFGEDPERETGELQAAHRRGRLRRTPPCR